MHHELFNAKTVVASGSETSLEVPLREMMTAHSIQYRITGDGTQQFVVYVRVSGAVDWIVSNTYSGLVKTSGPGSDGKDIIPLSLKPGDTLKVVATETGGVNGNVVSMYFNQM